ncbi:hypothetical protein GIB67_042953, partial [Kingdonia uniflora]
MNILQGSEFETESAQAGLGAQPPLPNIFPDFDVNILIVEGYSEEIFENNLLQDLNAFKSLKAGGAGNSLSLKKLKEHYAYKLEKVLSDGTAAAAKNKKGLTARSVARAYMLYVLGSFLFPSKKGTDVSARYLVLFANDKVAKKWSWGSAVLAHMYYNLGAASQDDGRQFTCCTTLLESGIFAHFPKLVGIPKELDSNAYEHYDDVGIHQKKSASVNEHGDTPVHQSEDIAEQYDASTSECDLLKETIEQMKVEIELKRVVDEQCALEFSDMPKQLDVKYKENESLKAFNMILMEQIDMQLPPTTTHKKLVNSEERKKTLEVDNNEWEVWRQVLKKALASERMGDMGDPTFEEFFEQNKRFFTIAQQGPKGDYQEDLVSTAVTLENIVIARREKMAKKKKMQKLLFQPWTKYLVDVRGVKISDNNSDFK